MVKPTGNSTAKQDAELFELGFSTFFLNRTNRSGVLKAGVIGGLEQTGPYKIDARYNKKQLIERITLIAKHRDKFIIHNDDAINLLRRYRNIASKNLVYLDPPYYEKGRELYVNFLMMRITLLFLTPYNEETISIGL